MDSNSVLIYKSKVVDSVISIAIPTFKRSDLLYEAVMSAINQKATVKYDIIVVDNNPERNDETEQMMMQFENHPLVSYYKNTSNLGMVGNWNQLFILAAGQWVAMLHDDDLLYSNYVSIMNEGISCLDHPSVIFPSHETSNNRKILNTYIGSFSNSFKKLSLESFIVGNIVGPPIGMLVNRSFFNKNVTFRTDFYPSIDWDFYMEASSLGNVYYIYDKLCLYYIGMNESLKDDTIIGFYRNAHNFNHRLSYKLKFPYNIINKLCYRHLITNTISWTSKLSDGTVIAKALAIIGYKRNKILEIISTIIARVFTHVNHYYESRYTKSSF